MSSTLYELLYIIDASLEEGDIQQLTKDVRSIIENGKGEVLKDSNWGRRPLSFPINKRTDGYYINIDFKGSADIPKSITEYVQTHAGILRHLTLKVPKAKLLQQKQDEERKEKELQAAREAREEALATPKAQDGTPEIDSPSTVSDDRKSISRANVDVALDDDFEEDEVFDDDSDSDD